MNKVKIEIIDEGLRELLKSSEVMNACKAEAQRLASQYGGDADTQEYIKNNRANVSVSANLSEAMADNQLLKAVH